MDSVDGRGEVGLWEENQTTDVGIFVDTLREQKLIPPWGKRKIIDSKVPFFGRGYVIVPRVPVLEQIMDLQIGDRLCTG